MLYLVAYLLFILLELLFSIGICFYTLSLLISALKGAPYVPTKQKELEFIFKEAHLKKGQTFLELGCGDGRVVRFAAQKYGVNGIGIDVNPMLIKLAQLKTYFKHIKNATFIRVNINNCDISHADSLYLFLMPEFIQKLVPRFETELKKGTLVISHGFKVPGWDKNLDKTLTRKPFPTYYYVKN